MSEKSVMTGKVTSPNAIQNQTHMSGNVHFNMRSSGIGEIVFAQPKKRNAINSSMWASIPPLLDTASKTKGLRVLIARGEGDHFASGADISEFEKLYATLESSNEASQNIAAALTALAEFPTPTVAMIRGACVGGGCGLALSCDFRFADTSSKFAITPAKLGLLYPFSDVQRLIETVGTANAQDILFSARLIKAKEAKRMGLINTLCKADKLESKTLSYAENLAALSPYSLKMTKKMFASYKSGQFTENEQSRRRFLDGFSGPDFKEGYKAFLEKRSPKFR